MSPGRIPRLSLLTMYAPPPLGYARTVWRYDDTTMISSAAMAIEIGMASATVPALATRRTRRISSVAYATEDSASDENTGSARILGSSVCSSRSLATARPTRTRFSTPLPEPEVGRAVVDTRGFYVDGSATQR